MSDPKWDQPWIPCSTNDPNDETLLSFVHGKHVHIEHLTLNAPRLHNIQFFIPISQLAE